MTLLDRYLARYFALATAGVLAVLLVLFGFVDLAEELEDVGIGSYTVADAIAVTLLTMPRRIVDLLPVTALLGAVLGIGTLANHQEIVAMRAAGRSPWQLARACCLVAIGLIVLTAVLQNNLVPAAEREAREFRSRTLAQTALGGAEFWSRHENRFVRVGGVVLGRIPRDIEIYELGERGHLRRLLRADRAEILDAERWRLFDVEENVLDGNRVDIRVIDAMDWDSFLTPEQLSTLITPVEALSAFDLYRYVRETKRGDVSIHNYEMMLWRQLSVPLALVAMTLLGLPFVLGSVRTMSSGYRIVLGGTAGIAFYLLDQITRYVAVIFEMPAAPAALAPACVVLALAALSFRRLV